MKRLIVMRHAKALARDPGGEDFDRPLSEDGQSAAALMGAFMKERGLAPDCVLSSPSARTRETFALALQQSGGSPQIFLPRRLYNAAPNAILAEINAAPEACAHILLVGHNPGLHLVALDLADPTRSDDDALMRLGAKFPPGALAHFDLTVSRWRDAGQGRGALSLFVTPKELGRADSE